MKRESCQTPSWSLARKALCLPPALPHQYSSNSSRPLFATPLSIAPLDTNDAIAIISVRCTPSPRNPHPCHRRSMRTAWPFHIRQSITTKESQVLRIKGVRFEPKRSSAHRNVTGTSGSAASGFSNPGSLRTGPEHGRNKRRGALSKNAWFHDWKPWIW